MAMTEESLRMSNFRLQVGRVDLAVQSGVVVCHLQVRSCNTLIGEREKIIVGCIQVHLAFCKTSNQIKK